MKSGKEVKLLINNKFKTLYGTVDNKNLKTIYIKILTWAEPIEDFDVYTSQISRLRKSFKNTLNIHVPTDKFKQNKYIVDFDIKNSGVIYGKKSYLNINITLFTENDMEKITSPEYRQEMVELIRKLLNTLNNNSVFKFDIKK